MKQNRVTTDIIPNAKVIVKCLKLKTIHKAASESSPSDISTSVLESALIYALYLCDFPPQITDGLTGPTVKMPDEPLEYVTGPALPLIHFPSELKDAAHTQSAPKEARAGPCLTSLTQRHHSG